MSSPLFGILIATLLAAQATPPTALEKKPAALISVTGCISQDAAAPGSYLFSDPSTGASYRVSGLDGAKAAGQRGHIVIGTGSRRVTIRGGLVPSPNVAAQAGALDPAKAANARTPSTPGTPSASLPEFRAERIRISSGSCP
jgi:hypothetical protein